MGSSRPQDRLPSDQPHSPPTTFSPTPQEPRWMNHWWNQVRGRPDDESIPIHSTPPTNSHHGPRHHQGTPHPAPAMYPEPRPPPRSRTTGTYGLGTNSSHCPPTTLPTFHPLSGRLRQPDPITSWRSPRRGYAHDPPPDAFPPLSPAARRMIQSTRSSVPRPPQTFPPPTDSSSSIPMKRTNSNSPSNEPSGMEEDQTTPSLSRPIQLDPTPPSQKTLSPSP
ncbi:hypothetical protein ARMSODRAFT_897836, partial [Armillaria solidipes]